MNAGQKSVRRIAANNAYLSRDSICTSCMNRLSQQARQYAAAAAAVAGAPVAQATQQHVPPVTSTAPRKACRILASPVVSRPPLITRDLTSFEKAYYLYQKRLNERLALPFTRYFYYKKGTPADLEWKRKARGRKTAARDIGVYSGYGNEAWNDEVLVGDQLAEPDSMRENLIRDAEGKEIVSAQPVGDKAADGTAIAGQPRAGEGTRKDMELQIERPMSRLTEADEKNDTKSLNRKLDQSLYLMIRNKDGRWRFPEDRLYAKETLHDAAERIIVQSAGINMNTWVVGNHPVGHFHFDYPKPQIRTLAHHQQEITKDAAQVKVPTYQEEQHGEKVFFMKARIMAGQADLTKNIYGDQEFLWLAKGEIEERVTPKYWSSVRNMLTER